MFGVCVQPNRQRTFAFGGLGRKLDFVVYQHSAVRGGLGDHDHLLVFRRLPSGERALAFSCEGTLPRSSAKLSAALADGRCTEELGPVETD